MFFEPLTTGDVRWKGLNKRRRRFNSLAHKENTHSDPVGQAKNFNCILFSWGSDIISRLQWLKY
jgi:hypothetical protein